MVAHEPTTNWTRIATSQGCSIQQEHLSLHRRRFKRDKIGRVHPAKFQKGRNQCRELPLCAGSREGCQWQPYPRLCNARRPRLEPGTFRSQAIRLYRLYQARPSQQSFRALHNSIQVEDWLPLQRFHSALIALPADLKKIQWEGMSKKQKKGC